MQSRGQEVIKHQRLKKQGDAMASEGGLADYLLDRKSRVATRRIHQMGGEQPGGGMRNANADQSGRHGVPLAERIFQVGGDVDQAQVAGRAVEEPDREMFFKLPNQAGDR
jgi:hypothetical protein